MTSAINIAKAIVKESLRQEVPATHHRLHILLYITYCYGILHLKRPMFTNGVQAWISGPLVKDVMVYYRLIGESEEIPKPKFFISFLTEKELALIRSVISICKRLTTEQLHKMITAKGSAWREHYSDKNFGDDAHPIFYTMDDNFVISEFASILSNNQSITEEEPKKREKNVFFIDVRYKVKILGIGAHASFTEEYNQEIVDWALKKAVEVGEGDHTEILYFDGYDIEIPVHFFVDKIIQS